MSLDTNACVISKTGNYSSICLVDIVGMAGNCIAGYEREWFDELALPLLQKR